MLDRYEALNLFEVLPDLEQGTYMVRMPAAIVGNADTFETIPLSYLKRRPATRKDFTSPPEIVLLDEYVVFMLFQYDIDESIAQSTVYSPQQAPFPVPPDPQLSFLIVDQTGGSQYADTNGTAVTDLTQTSGLRVGMEVIGQGVLPGTTILSITNESELKLNQAVASALNSIVLTFGIAWVIIEGVRHQTMSRWDLTCKRAR